MYIFCLFFCSMNIYENYHREATSHGTSSNLNASVCNVQNYFMKYLKRKKLKFDKLPS